MSRSKKAEPKKNELAIYGVSDAMVLDMDKQKLEAKKLVPMLTAAKCDSQSQYLWFSEKKADLRALHKDIDEKRTTITKPMNKAKRDVDALFGALKDIEKALEVVEAKLLTYDRAQMKAQQEALATAQEAAAKGDALAAAAAIDSLPTIVEGAGHTIRPTLAYTVTDLSKVDVKFLCVNEAAMKAYIKEWEKSGSIEVPTEAGLMFELDVATRAKPV